MKRPPIILGVADWEPDQPDYMNPGSGYVLNVIPRTQKSYGPLAMPAPLGNGALTARCQGAFFGIGSDGTVDGFAGDANDLYSVQASTNWTNVSKVAGGYNIVNDEQWKFVLYGQRVIALNIADPLQSFILGSSSAFADLITTANPPKARFAAVVKSFLVLGNTSDPVYGANPQRVWWSRNGDPTQFDTPGSALAATFQTSFQDLLGNGGWIQGIVGGLGTADMAVFMDHQIVRGVWVGGNVVFDFFPAEGVRGTPAPGSIAQLGPLVYYLGEDGFYSFDGSNSTPIGATRVDRTFFADLDATYMGSVCSAIDPINKLYIVGYPGSGHTGSNCNKMLIYNWQLDKWSQAMPIGGGSFEIISRALSFGYTLDQLYTILGYNLDNLPFVLDSRVWTGGNLLMGIFDTNHMLNFFTGVPLDATIDTSEVQPVPGGVTRVYNTRPIVDGNVVPTVSIWTRNRQNDSQIFGTPISMDALGNAPQRAVGRYIGARLTVPSSSSWSHISACELEGAPAGGRY